MPNTAVKDPKKKTNVTEKKVCNIKDVKSMFIEIMIQPVIFFFDFF